MVGNWRLESWDLTKTRQVPYTKKVYRDDPVKKPWYIYKTKQWTPAGY